MCSVAISNKCLSLSQPESTSISNLMAGLASQLPGASGHLGEGGIPPVGELDPATGLFYNPSSSEGIYMTYIILYIKLLVLILMYVITFVNV